MKYYDCQFRITSQDILIINKTKDLLSSRSVKVWHLCIKGAIGNSILSPMQRKLTQVRLWNVEFQDILRCRHNALMVEYNHGKVRIPISAILQWSLSYANSSYSGLNIGILSVWPHSMAFLKFYPMFGNPVLNLHIL